MKWYILIMYKVMHTALLWCIIRRAWTLVLKCTPQKDIWTELETLLNRDSLVTLLVNIFTPLFITNKGGKLPIKWGCCKNLQSILYNLIPYMLLFSPVIPHHFHQTSHKFFTQLIIENLSTSVHKRFFNLPCFLIIWSGYIIMEETRHFLILADQIKMLLNPR